MDLNPYLWGLAVQAGADGTPVTRPAKFEFPFCDCDDAMFMLGDAILVAPVITAGATTRDVVLPAGVWQDWWTGETVIGDDHTVITVPAPLTRMPIWQRGTTMVPMFARAADTLIPATAPGVTSYADPAFGRELRLRMFPWEVILDGDIGASATVHDGGVAGETVVVDGTLLLHYAPGTDYDIVTFDAIDPALVAPATVTAGADALPAVADEAALFACPSPGCYLAETGRLRVRLFAADHQDVTVAP
jgi:hypothetical protein